jgi:malate synthase
LVGYQGDAKAPSSVLLVHNGLHLDIRIDRASPIGKTDPPAWPTWCWKPRCPPSSTWRTRGRGGRRGQGAGLPQLAGHPAGTLTESFDKGGKTVTRGLNADRVYTARRQGHVRLHGRSLMFVRNVGHLMTNPAILWGADGSEEIPEGILDAVVTTAIALHDLQGHGANGIRNSRTGSVYIVKPKMHGPAEVGFAASCSAASRAAGPADSTVKLGIMDEERRTSVNLKACIAAASRVAFINTGFLDRTGDEMHTAMHAGPMMRKGDMKTSAWIQAYERSNVLAACAACAAARRSARACGPCPT